MAFQTRDRDPLLDSHMAEVIGKRSQEVFGLGLIALGVMAALMVGSYSPDDPSWMSSTDAPIQNWLGRPGASIAAPLFMIVGWAAWAVALVPLVWGLRMVLHRGDYRAFGRLIYAPIWIAVLSLFCASLVPGGNWASVHSFGLGGLFGDMGLGALLSVLPFGASVVQGLLSLVLGLGALWLGGYVLGFTRHELRDLGRTVLLYVLYALAWGQRLLGRSATQAIEAGYALKSNRDQRRLLRDRERQARLDEEMAQQAYPSAAPLVRRAPLVAEPRYKAPPLPDHDLSRDDDEPSVATPMSAPGLIPRVAGLIRRQPAEPETALFDAEIDDVVAYDQVVPEGDRIRARITDAIRTRARRGVAESHGKPQSYSAAARRLRGPKPLVLNTTRPVAAALPPEPPLTAAPAPRWQEPVLRAPRPLETPMIEVEPLLDMSEDMAAPQVLDDDYEPYDSYEPEPEVVPVPRVAQAAPARPVVQHPVRKPVVPSARARSEAQPSLQFAQPEEPYYELPPLSLLSDETNITRCQLSDEALEQNARMLENVLDDYGVKGEIVSVRPGPVVTMYELEPAPGLKASRVIGLADDIARSMSALSARVSTVPGRSVIGIELPNEHREMVLLRELLSTRQYGDGKLGLPLALGKDIGGDPMITNLAKMPHLLIAGTTGSGKSVAINTMILSLLYRLTPDQCRLIMIDPKMLELSVYDGIPHLLSPVVTDPKKAVVALKWVVAEMEERYRKMSKMGVRNIDGYNGRVADALSRGEMFSRTMQTGFDDETGDPVFETEEFAPEKMPYIVVIVDEMADLMMVAGKEIEACIQRLAQMARASGIHLIMATQRPSVDVITGTIKANFPTRISFQVTSKIDSRTILGEMGAEQLLGMGDMLYMAGGGKITRCHGPFVSDEEVEEVVKHLKSFGPPEYLSGVVEGPDEDKASNIDAVLGLGGNTDGEDALYDQAVQVVLQDRKCSTSYIQRKLAIGYNKAARLVEQMEDEGLVSPANHVGKRDILVPEQ